MTVAELIKLLSTMPQDYQVCDYEGDMIVGAYTCVDPEDEKYKNWVQLRSTKHFGF